jgi:arsenite methyltransferase
VAYASRAERTLEFDDQVAAQLEAFYRTRDVLRRRRLAIDALGALAGEDVLDLGCGPGFYVQELLQRVGADGSVTGIDPAPAMLAMTADRVSGADNVRVLQGGADAIPLPDASVDRALSVQVFEYIADVPHALAELRRVVRPGGRVVIWDIDWSTLSMHGEEPERMQHMLRAWDRHLVHTTLPRTLGGDLREAGFADVSVDGHLFTSTTMDPQSFGGNFPGILGRYVRGLDDVPAQEVDAWLAELAALDARGAYFFSLTQFCFQATR